MKEYRYWIYIMGSFTGVLYIGFTNNLQRRVYEHQLKRWNRSKKVTLIKRKNPDLLDLSEEIGLI